MFDWKDLVQAPYSRLDSDAFTRVRVILMNGIESEAIRFSHAFARMNPELQPELAQIRRVEQHQQTLVSWLHPGDQSPLETTLGFEQVAIEITAAVAQSEPDQYRVQIPDRRDRRRVKRGRSRPRQVGRAASAADNRGCVT